MPPISNEADAILLYEDDEPLAGEIAMAFAAEGRRVEMLADEAALLRQRAASVIILDRMVDGRDCLDVVQRMRAEGRRMPVLVISSLATVDDRIHGLKAGGDDYLVKPFAMGELLARVAALERRAAPAETTRLVVGPLAMDLVARTVRCGARAVDLLPREFSLLEYFMRHAGQVVTRAMLLEHVWHYRLSVQTNVVDVHVGTLRRKLEAGGGSRLIGSVRGIGFMLSAEQAPRS